MNISPIFGPLFNDHIDDKRYYQVYGGRGSAKSFSTAAAAVKKTYSEFKHKILYLRQTMASSDDSTIADVELVMNMFGVREDFTYAKNTYTNRKTGSTIVFKGIESKGSHTAKLKSLSGITTLIIEEAEELKDFDEFSKIDESIRVVDKPLKVILVYNPGASVNSWIHSEWFIDGQPNPERFHDTIYLHSTFYDNMDNLAPSTVQRYKDLKSKNYTYYIQTILAEWTLDASNRIYAGWHEFDSFMESGGETWYGLDFGYGGSDCSALVEIKYFEGMHLIREIFCQEKLDISDMANLMKRAGIRIHDLVVADSAAPILITELRKHGFSNIRRAKKGSGSKEQGIKKVQDMDIAIVGENDNLYKAYLTFSKGKDGKLPHEPDVLAALRYGLTYKHTGAKGREVRGGGKVISNNRYQ